MKAKIKNLNTQVKPATVEDIQPDTRYGLIIQRSDFNAVGSSYAISGNEILADFEGIDIDKVMLKLETPDGDKLIRLGPALRAQLEEVKKAYDVQKTERAEGKEAETEENSIPEQNT